MRTYPVNLLRNQERVHYLQSLPMKKGGVLLYGSSFFTRWVNAEEEMSAASEGKYLVVNHGFGGATVDDLLYHYSRLVTGCDPRVVVFRMGPNDFAHGFTGRETWDMAWRLAEYVRADYPDVKLVFLCAFDFKSLKPELLCHYEEFNGLQEEYAKETENAYYLDINEFFYESPSDIGTFKNFRDVFVEDGLHLKPEIYKEFAAYFVTKLDELQLV